MARRKRQLVLTGTTAPGNPTMIPLGTLKDVTALLADFNTGLDGAADRASGIRLLHGPGFVVELPTSLDPVSQGLVTINDEDIAMSVLFRICKKHSWRMTDMETGRTFG
jgi:hypothetical protein